MKRLGGASFVLVALLSCGDDDARTPGPPAIGIAGVERDHLAVCFDDTSDGRGLAELRVQNGGRTKAHASLVGRSADEALGRSSAGYIDFADVAPAEIVTFSVKMGWQHDRLGFDVSWEDGWRYGAELVIDPTVDESLLVVAPPKSGPVKGDTASVVVTNRAPLAAHVTMDLDPALSTDTSSFDLGPKLSTTVALRIVDMTQADRVWKSKDVVRVRGGACKAGPTLPRISGITPVPDEY